MARRRIRRATAGKVGIAHAGTFLENTGSGSAPDQFEIMLTSGGARNIAGTLQTVTDNRDTGVTNNIGDCIKYVNLFIQCSPRLGQTSTDRTGWLEWAFVCVKESEANVPITNMGTETLGVVCNRMFRNECIMTGNIPIGAEIPNSVNIQIKIPKTKMYLRLGDEWRFISFFRSSESTSSSTAAVRLLKSFMYKAYY